MDRFSSREDVSFDSVAENHGRAARKRGEKLDQNPYNPSDSWLHKSWKAGWCDADMDFEEEEVWKE